MNTPSINDWSVRATASIQKIKTLQDEVDKLDDLSLEQDLETVSDDAKEFLRMICNRVNRFEYRLKKAKEKSPA